MFFVWMFCTKCKHKDIYNDMKRTYSGILKMSTMFANGTTRWGRGSLCY